MQRLPVSLTLRGTLLRRQGDIVGRHQYGDRSRRQCQGLLVPQGIDRLQSLSMGDKYLVQHLPQILQEIKAVGDLRSGRSSLPRAPSA
jgi:hypothetical protein